MLYFFNKEETASGSVCTAYRADISGNLSVWNIPKFSDDKVAKHATKALVFKPDVETSLSETWSSLERPPHNIFDTQVI